MDPHEREATHDCPDKNEFSNRERSADTAGVVSEVLVGHGGESLYRPVGVGTLVSQTGITRFLSQGIETREPLSVPKRQGSVDVNP